MTLTNHALDEFLSDLLDVGIEPSDMVRFGGKASSRTHSLLLSEQQSPFRFNVKDWTQCINPLKADARARSQAIENTFRRHIYSRVRNEDILVYLEFDEPSFFSAFKVPEEDEGMTTVGRKGKSISADGLLETWCKGGRIPTWARSWENVTGAQDIWSMTLEARQDLLHSWTAAIRQEEATQLTQSVIGYNRVVDSLAAKFRQKDRNILQSKRIIAATTTGAAKYQKEIAAASPDIVLVEEAGELLEAHVVTSLGESAKQCILIGDHKYVARSS